MLVERGLPGTLHVVSRIRREQTFEGCRATVSNVPIPDPHTTAQPLTVTVTSRANRLFWVSDFFTGFGAKRGKVSGLFTGALLRASIQLKIGGFFFGVDLASFPPQSRGGTYR